MRDINFYLDAVKALIAYEDFSIFKKKLIDITLDTDNLLFYEKTTAFLRWVDTNPEPSQKRERGLALFEELQLFLTSKAVSSDCQPLISVHNLKKTYRKSHFSLGEISFEIEAGMVIGLVGENGNGKTTLLRMLCGELLEDSGRIDYHFKHRDLYDLRSQLIYIPQQHPIWHGTLLTNLHFTAASYGITGRENELLVDLVIERMGLWKYRDFTWKRLSSGYKMRFELARAMLRKPKLLLIDEPLANLDIIAQQVVLDDLREIAASPFRPIGVVLSSQQLYEVEKSSNFVIFLKEGYPQNLENNVSLLTENHHTKCIFEFETKIPYSEIKELLNSLQLENLQLNGGTFVATFPAQISQNDFLKLILEKEVDLLYFRNISQSTRRYFLS